MFKMEKAFKLFDEGKDPTSPEVKALGLKSHTISNYYFQWKNKGKIGTTEASPKIEYIGSEPLSKEDEAEHLAKMAELRKRNNKGWGLSLGTEPEENPFRVTGEINLGTINFADELAKAREELTDLQKNYEREGQELRERLHHAEMEALKTLFESKINILSRRIEDNTNQASFTEQLSAIRKGAEELGYRPPASEIDYYKLGELIGTLLTKFLKEKG